MIPIQNRTFFDANYKIKLDEICHSVPNHPHVPNNPHLRYLHNF
jgi:hypothetical protein